ncbi:MAG: prepilin-type N-terminal cleavage/methylation domain-containing protein [Nitrospira sp.]
MARVYVTRRARSSPGSSLASIAGFTLLEMMAVVAIAGILATLALPTYTSALLKARETALKQGLFVLRDVIDQYRADHGKYPETVAALKESGYLRMVPQDPFTRSSETWQEIPDSTEPGISDVHSGSMLVSVSDGKPYNEW